MIKKSIGVKSLALTLVVGSLLAVGPSSLASTITTYYVTCHSPANSNMTTSVGGADRDVGGNQGKRGTDDNSGVKGTPWTCNSNDATEGVSSTYNDGSGNQATNVTEPVSMSVKSNQDGLSGSGDIVEVKVQCANKIDIDNSRTGTTKTGTLNFVPQSFALKNGTKSMVQNKKITGPEGHFSSGSFSSNLQCGTYAADFETHLELGFGAYLQFNLGNDCSQTEDIEISDIVCTPSWKGIKGGRRAANSRANWPFPSVSIDDGYQGSKPAGWKGDVYTENGGVITKIVDMISGAKNGGGSHAGSGGHSAND